MFLLTQIILGCTLLGNSILLFFLYKAPHTAAVRIFTAYVLLVSLWTAGILANLWFESLFVEQIIFAAASLFLLAQYWFIKIYPQRNEPIAVWEYWSIIAPLFFCVISFMPGTLFTAISIHEHGHTILDTGPFLPAYSLFGLVYVLLPLGILFRKYWNAKHHLRTQLKSLLLGFGCFVFINLFTNMILPVYFNIYIFNAIGPVFSLIFALFIFYLIRKHEFFDIRHTLQRGAIYSLTLGCILVCYILLLSFIERTVSVTVAAPVSALLLLVVGIYTIPVIEKLFTQWTDRIFFKGHYDYPEALETLSAILHESINFETLLERIEKTLAKTLRASRVEIMLAEQGTECTAKHIALREPIRIDTEIIGHIVVCEKQSGDPYTEEDKHLITTFAYNAATALGRARLYKEVQGYATTLEKRVAERTREIQSLHENQRQMMCDIAHGLQTPLAIFKNQLEGSNLAEHDASHRSLMDLSHFIDDLLMLAKLDTTDEKDEMETVSLSQILIEVFEEVATIAANENITVTTAIASNIDVIGNTAELRSVFINLASNALKYMREDGPRTITCTLIKKANTACISLQDTGIGISENDIPHIFTRFYRVQTPKNTVRGSGLGLAITNRIIERHGGTITVNSVHGEGSTFTISLPIQ